MRKNTREQRAASVKKPTKIMSREELLGLLAKVIESQADKIRRGRVRDKEAFAQKIRAVRALFYSASIYLSGLKDEDLTKVMAELEELEKLGAEQANP